MKTKSLIVGLSLIALSVGATRGKNVEAENETNAPPSSVDAVQIHAHLDRPLLVRGGGEQEVIVKIEVTGTPVIDVEMQRPPLNLAVVLDRSGSMTGAKLEKARQAAMMLVDQLGADDVVSLVVYDSEVQVVARAQRVGKRQAELKRLIGKIEPGGSTALYAGVKSGGDQLAEYLSDEAINRVLLLSDGIANVGPKSNREIVSLGQKLTQRGMSVSTIGLGDDYNEDLMTALAESSDANYYFVDDVEMLAEVFENEIGELKSVVARKLVVDIEFPKGVRPQRYLGREDSFEKNAGTIRFSMLAGEQSREIMLSCLVDPAIFRGTKGDESSVVDVRLSYDDPLSASERGGLNRREVQCQAVVGLTDDVAVAEKKIDQSVRADAAVWVNADVSREAIALVDAGKGAEAEQKIDRQIIKLRSAQAAAPAGKQKALKREIGVLEESQATLKKSGDLDGGSRKRLQWSIFNRANAKNLDSQK